MLWYNAQLKKYLLIYEKESGEREKESESICITGPLWLQTSGSHIPSVYLNLRGYWGIKTSLAGFEGKCP